MLPSEVLISHNLKQTHLNSGGSKGIGVSSIGSIGVGTISITAEEGVSGVGEGNSGGGGLNGSFGLSLISLAPLSGLTCKIYGFNFTVLLLK